MTAASAVPTVVYIMGSGRSGTTLLGSILDEYAGVFNAGEVSYLWERGILEPRGCGCGRAPLECPIWGPVIDRVALGRDPRALASRMVALRNSLRLRHTRGILSGPPLALDADLSPRNNDPNPVVEYGAVLQSVYQALAAVTGATTLVDTSKHPADAALVGRLAGIRPVFVHLVRDPRAVAHSWRRRKEGIARRKVPLAAADWLVTNRAADLVRARHPDASIFVRYEDLMANPAELTHRIAALSRISEPTPFLDDGTLVLGENHTVSGNPDRFVAGPTALRLDDRWRSDMRPSARMLVTALAWSGMRRYGYPLRA